MTLLRMITVSILALFAMCFESPSADKVNPSQKPAQASSDPIAAVAANARHYEILHLSKPIEQAILAAGHGRQIAFVEDVILKTNLKAQLLIVTVGLVPKSDKSWEGILHKGFVVVADRNQTITVYFQDEEKLSVIDLIANWLSDEDYELPVGKGLTKLYTTKGSH